MRQALTDLVNKVIKKKGLLRVPAWWMHHVLAAIADRVDRLQTIGDVGMTALNGARLTKSLSRDRINLNLSLTTLDGKTRSSSEVIPTATSTAAGIITADQYTALKKVQEQQTIEFPVLGYYCHTGKELKESAERCMTALIPLDRTAPIKARISAGIYQNDDKAAAISFFDAAGNHICGVPYPEYKSFGAVDVNVPPEDFPATAAYFCVMTKVQNRATATFTNGSGTDERAQQALSKVASQAALADIAARMAEVEKAAAAARELARIATESTTPQQILETRGAEALRALRPDVLAVVEPADATVIIEDPDKTHRLATAVDGVITTEAIGGGVVHSCHNVAAIHYWNLDNGGLRPPTYVWCNRFGFGAPASRLALIENIVGWGDNPTIENNMLSWWIETWNGGHYLADHVSLRGSSWGSKNTVTTDFMLNMVDRAVTFDELPDEIIISPLCSGVGWMFSDVKTLRYPTIDFTGCKNIRLGLHCFCNLQAGKLDGWMPERPQRAFFKGIGEGEQQHITFIGIKDWDYDDMIATLVTHSFDRAAAKLKSVDIQLYQHSYEKLTDEDLAAITAKGYTVASYTKGSTD